MDGLEDASQMEINLSNTNANSQIVLNDLRLLELIYMYPFLFSKAVRPQNDKDYEEWGWGEIVKAFNLSYEGLELSAPFSVEELQWRWYNLRPICPTLGKACGQIPSALRDIVSKINQMMNVKPPANIKGLTSTQQFLLDQLPFIEQLSTAHQRQLEVEVLDAIFKEERKVRLVCKDLGKKELAIVLNEYDAFLKAIRVKELPVQVSSRRSSASSNGSSKPDSSAAARSSNLVISDVRGHSEPQPEPANPPTSPLVIKNEPPDQLEIELQPLSKQSPDKEADPRLRYVPLKSAKYYVKKVQVRLKRLDLADYMPLSYVRKTRNRSS
ncbi:uncharacterized protein Lhr [Drosophila virilis]|uniref:Lethal hybrid rescue protein n=1 Tax=Drosophila virilis TaxID=7244 RepID=A0PKA8_DROVI|nr:uncharacterized protein LOC6625892 [Drosophila virilis]EDW61306.1 Lhr [Drosophila virilis]DAA05826.1 TPA_inf: lethal hybrid rescue protein [Drosophila virilis]